MYGGKGDFRTKRGTEKRWKTHKEKPEETGREEETDVSVPEGEGKGDGPCVNEEGKTDR